MTLTPLDLLILGALGLATGVLGGLLGIGGSILMIPGMIFLFHDADPDALHMYLAAGMTINFAIAAPSAIRHKKAGAIRPDLLRVMLPSAAIAIVAGVLLANQISGTSLRRLFGVFLLFVGVNEFLKLTMRRPDHQSEDAKVTWPRGSFVGALMGFLAGLLGVGGGILAVPLSQALCRVPLRQAIAASSTAMCLTASVGATLKLATLSQHGMRWQNALLLALALAPTAILGAGFGARLTHALPLRLVRSLLLVIVIIASWKLLRG